MTSAWRQSRQPGPGWSAYPQKTWTPWAVRKMWLMREYDRHQPARILECNQPAGSSHIARKCFHLVEECTVFQRDGERLPTRFGNGRVERRRIAEIRSQFSRAFPRAPSRRCRPWSRVSAPVHGTKARRIGHRRVLHEDKIVSSHGDVLGLAVAAERRAGHRDFPVYVREVEIGDDAVLRKRTPGLRARPPAAGRENRID